MNTKAVKLALLKMNSEEIKSPREINTHNTPQMTKKGSSSNKNQFILSNATKVNPPSAYKLHLSSNHSEAKKVLSHRSESRNNKLSNGTNSTSSSASNSNYKSNLNSNYLAMVISPSNNIQQTNDLRNTKLNKLGKGIFSPPNFQKLISIDSIPKVERLKTPKTAVFNQNRQGNNSKIAETLDVMSLLCNQNYVPLSLSTLQIYFANYESTKCSTKQIKQLKGYAANTNQGLIR